MVERSCPIREMAKERGLPSCNFECEEPPIDKGPDCPHTKNDDLFPWQEVLPNDLFVGLRVVVYKSTSDMLSILSDIHLTIFDKKSKKPSPMDL